MMTSVGEGRKAAKELEDEPGAIRVAKGLKNMFCSRLVYQIVWRI
jgi:hypothetical protein